LIDLLHSRDVDVARRLGHTPRSHDRVGVLGLEGLDGRIGLGIENPVDLDIQALIVLEERLELRDFGRIVIRTKSHRGCDKRT